MNSRLWHWFLSQDKARYVAVDIKEKPILKMMYLRGSVKNKPRIKLSHKEGRSKQPLNQIMKSKRWTDIQWQLECWYDIKWSYQSVSTMSRLWKRLKNIIINILHPLPGTFTDRHSILLLRIEGFEGRIIVIYRNMADFTRYRGLWHYFDSILRHPSDGLNCLMVRV